MESGTIYLITARHPNGVVFRCRVNTSVSAIDNVLLRYHGRSDDQTLHQFTTLNGYPVAISGRVIIEYTPLYMHIEAPEDVLWTGTDNRDVHANSNVHKKPIEIDDDELVG